MPKTIRAIDSIRNVYGLEHGANKRYRRVAAGVSASFIFSKQREREREKERANKNNNNNFIFSVTTDRIPMHTEGPKSRGVCYT